jgi:hypothetical protein
MKVLNYVLYVGIAMSTAMVSCKKESAVVSTATNSSTKNASSVLWTDFMNDGFDSGWAIDLGPNSSWWLQTATGIYWSIINNPPGTGIGRAEVSRKLTNYTGVDKTVIVKGKFKMETTADGGKFNEGGWILQTMAWGFKDPRDSVVYKPLVVARMLPDRVDYLVYDYVWNATGKKFEPKTGFPVQRIVKSANMAGQTIELALTIKFNRGTSGSVRANLDGVNITSANYDGVTYPSIFPYTNTQVQWKGGCYSSYPGEHYSKIGVYYLYTDQAQ